MHIKILIMQIVQVWTCPHISFLKEIEIVSMREQTPDPDIKLPTIYQKGLFYVFL